MPLNVQGELNDVDQKVYLLLIYEIGQRPENQITCRDRKWSRENR